MTSTKIVVTHEGALKKKYKAAGLSVIQAALRQMVAVDASRGVATALVALDRASIKAVAGRPRTFKAAIDHVFLAHNRPDYILILGGPDIVPHQMLRNPLFDPQGEDLDRKVPSDLPYACDAGYSTAIEDFLGPSRVVGRLPDLPGDKTPDRLVAVIMRASQARMAARPGNGVFAVSCDEWKQSTRKSVAKLVGSRGTVRLSPPDGPAWTSRALQAPWHFINLHGAPADPQFYGQRGDDFPVAHQASHLPTRVKADTVVAAECCYGAELVKARHGSAGIAPTYLVEGAVGLVGSTNIAYGPADGNDYADLICRFFLAEARGGASLGRALLEARQQYIAGAVPLDPVALKTVGQFLLLGDPSVHRVAPKPPAKAAPAVRARPASSPAARAVTHSLRRGALVRTAELLSRGADSVRTGVRTTTRSGARAAMAKAAEGAGLSTSGSVRTFEVAPAPDKAARKRLTGRPAPSARACVRFHVWFAKAIGRKAPRLESKAARGPGTRVASSKPAGVQPHALLVARDQGGQVTIKKLFARLAPVGLAMSCFEGVVIRKFVATGSKSERRAVVLRTDDDKELVLRREGGNAFRDPVLDELVGHRIRGTGEKVGYTLILSQWDLVDQY